MQAITEEHSIRLRMQSVRHDATNQRWMCVMFIQELCGHVHMVTGNSLLRPALCRRHVRWLPPRRRTSTSAPRAR